MKAIAISEKKAQNWKESGEGYMESFGGREAKGKYYKCAFINRVMNYKSVLTKMATGRI